VADQIVEIAGERCLVVDPEGPAIGDARSAARLVGDSLGAGAKTVVVPVSRLDASSSSATSRHMSRRVMPCATSSSNRTVARASSSSTTSPPSNSASPRKRHHRDDEARQAAEGSPKETAQRSVPRPFTLEARKTMTDPTLLKEKVALVTGGSRGLGRAMVLGFAHAGADVIIASRKLDACEAVAEEVRQTTGRDAMAHACHVGRWQDVDALVEAAYDRFGRVDVLVNNAGMSPVYRKITDVTEDLYDKVLDVNLKGPFRLSALIGERMAARDGGSIINISSTAAIRPTPNVIPYSAAKAGLNAMTEAFALAYGPKVRVNCIMPGPFLTDISKAWDMPAFERQAQRFALRRGGDPDEIVGAAIYFASDASSFTTGAVLRIDGGSGV
jgi:NAD(P)-dependent dehydrogenase (short-subunit alcohol dehydrogenase family)